MVIRWITQTSTSLYLFDRQLVVSSRIDWTIMRAGCDVAWWRPRWTTKRSTHRRAFAFNWSNEMDCVCRQRFQHFDKFLAQQRDVHMFPGALRSTSTHMDSAVDKRRWRWWLIGQSRFISVIISWELVRYFQSISDRFWASSKSPQITVLLKWARCEVATDHCQPRWIIR